MYSFIAAGNAQEAYGASAYSLPRALLWAFLQELRNACQVYCTMVHTYHSQTDDWPKVLFLCAVLPLVASGIDQPTNCRMHCSRVCPAYVDGVSNDGLGQNPMPSDVWQRAESQWDIHRQESPYRRLS